MLSGLCLRQSISRLSVSCYQSSIEEDVETLFKKWFVLRDPVFPFWNMSLSKYFDIECFVLSKFDWRKCLSAFQKTICTETLCFLSGLFLCQKYFEIEFSCCQSSIEENVKTPFKKLFVLRDPVFLFWITHLSKKCLSAIQKTICTKRPCVSFLDYSFVKVFRDRVFVLSKFDWRKCLSAFQKTICTKRPRVSFLDYTFVKVFRDRVFVLSKFNWKKSLNDFQKTICTKRLCVCCLDYVFVKVFRDWVFRAIKVRLKKMSKRLSKNDLYWDPVFPFWIIPLSKVFRYRVFVLSKFDWRKCQNSFQKTICTKRPCASFLDKVFVKAFRYWVFRAIKVRLKQMSKRLS